MEVERFASLWRGGGGGVCGRVYNQLAEKNLVIGVTQRQG